jgi:anti-anti-sigma factor
MEVETTTRGLRGVISLRGRFDHSSRHGFLSAMRGVMGSNPIKEIEVNFGKVDYIDSSACGMLLLLNSKATKAGKVVLLSDAQGGVKKVFSMLKFKTLFTIV